MEMSPKEFEGLVAQAIGRLPDRFAKLVDNVFVVVEDEPAAEDLEALGLDPQEGDLLGLYQGVPLEDRGFDYGALPDRVVLYRLPILSICHHRDGVIREITDTLVHELGHHFGLADDEMPY